MAIAYVRDTGAVVGIGVGSVAASFGTLPAVGNRAIACGSSDFFQDPTSIADNQSNSWSVDAAQGGTQSDSALGSAYIATASGTFTTTLTFPGTHDLALFVAEFSGLVQTALDKTATANGFDLNLFIGPTATLSQVDELVVTTMTDSAITVAWGTPTGYTSLFETNGASGDRAMAGAYKVVAATTAVSAQWSNAASSEVIGHIGTYKGEVAAGTILTLLGQACL